MGVAAILVSALGYAIASAVIASLSTRIDTLSIAAVRSVAAALFIVPALFVLGAQGDVLSMDGGDIWQLIMAGMIGWGLGEPLYAISLGLLGLTRAYIIVTGVYSLGAFVFPVLFLGESVGWEAAVGAALIIAGVYVVAIFGRAGRDQGVPAAVAPTAGALSGAVELDYPPIRGGSGPEPEITEGRRAVLRAPGRGVGLSRGTVGTLAAVAAALAWAIDTTWLRSASEGFDAAAVAIVHVPGAALALLVYVLLLPGSALRKRMISRRAGTVIVASSIISGGIGSILFVFAIQKLGSGPAAVLFATSPLFALPLAVLFLRERVTIWAVVGTFAAIGGVVLLA
ncbi:MAG: DMT family transporter [Dehalococcoidia bacterium]